jgi:hypothetical protein
MNAHRITDLIDHIEETDLDGSVLQRLVLAKALLEGANELLSHAARETNDRNAMAYIVDHLGSLIGSNGGAGRAPTLSDWIERIEDRDAEQEEE